MSYVIVALGNPGEEYTNTRHNTGRLVLSSFLKQCGVEEWKEDVKLHALSAKGKFEGESVQFVYPETFMNNSGKSVLPLITSAKKAEKLIVVHDDLDMPLGAIKISWNRGPGGHNGVLSIQKTLKTEAFIRVRVGISPSTPGGKLKKPTGEKVEGFILGEFSKKELDALKKVSKKVAEAIAVILTKGREVAMGEFN